MRRRQEANETHLGWKAARSGLCRRMRRGHRIGLRARSPTVALSLLRSGITRLLSICCSSPPTRGRAPAHPFPHPLSPLPPRRPRRRRIKIHSTKERTRMLFTTESPTPERRLREECLSALAWRERSSSTSSAKEESPIFLSLCYELSGKPSPSKIGAFRLAVYLQCNHYRARLGSSQIARNVFLVLPG